MTQSLHECEQKLTGFEIQEEYHAADLRKELTHLKKILGEEKRKSHGDCGKLLELQTLFGSAMKSYNDTIEHIKHLEHKSKKNNDGRLETGRNEDEAEANADQDVWPVGSHLVFENKRGI